MKAASKEKMKFGWQLARERKNFATEDDIPQIKLTPSDLNLGRNLTLTAT